MSGTSSKSGSRAHGHGHGRGGGSHEEHEGAPEWLISFADNVTLMMGFFVIMLAISMKAAQAGGSNGDGKGQPSAYALDTILSIRAGFNRPVDVNSTDPREQVLVKRLRERNRGNAENRGVQGSYDQSQSIRPSGFYAICGVVTFALNSNEINTEGQSTVAQLAKQFQGVRSILEVRGNVSAAEAASLPDRGMVLATDRALAVARALTREGLIWAQLRIVACADNDRAKDRAYNAVEHLVNQRVEVVTTEEIIPEYLNNSEESPTAKPLRIQHPQGD